MSTPTNEVSSKKEYRNAFEEYIEGPLKGWYFTKIPIIRPGRSALSTYEAFSFKDLFELPYHDDYARFVEEYGVKDAFKRDSLAITSNTNGLMGLHEEFDWDEHKDLISPSLQHVFKAENFVTLSNSLHSITGFGFQLNNPIGPLKRYKEECKLFMVPFFKDEINVLTWYALFDKNVDYDRVGSIQKPLIVTGIVTCDELLDIDLMDLDLVAQSVEEFTWRMIIEGYLLKELKNIQIEELPNPLLRKYCNHYAFIEHKKHTKSTGETQQKHMMHMDRFFTDVHVFFL